MNYFYEILINALKAIVILLYVLSFAAILTFIERILLGRMQKRYGPNRAGPYGILQPVADAIKFLTKEPFIQNKGNKAFYLLAPAISTFAALAMWLVIPFRPIEIFGHTLDLQLLHLNYGVLYLIVISNIGTYGIILSGLSSDSRFSLYGTLRGIAQNVSYGILISLLLLTVVAYTGATSLDRTLEYQLQHTWNIIPLFASAIIYFIALLAETNRQPFDLPESEGELIAGYHTEYAGMKFGSFYLAEYINLISATTIFSIVFLGGYAMPFVHIPVLGPIFLFLKVALLIFIAILIRASFPRIKYADLMRLSWLFLIPLQLAIFMIVIFKQFVYINPYLLGLCNLVVIAAFFKLFDRVLERRREYV
jgi:NADH-quinone oxidoreductase subunit H